MLKTGEKNLDALINRMHLFVLTSYLSSHCPLLGGLSNLPMDVISSHFSVCSTPVNIFLVAFSCLFCSIPAREKDAQSCPFKSHYMHLKMCICIIPLVMVIIAQKGFRVGARKRKGGNATVAEVCSVNKLTFRNICHWALIISSLRFCLFGWFFPLKWINQELLHGQIAQRKHLIYVLFLKIFTLRNFEECLQ